MRVLLLCLLMATQNANPQSRDSKVPERSGSGTISGRITVSGVQPEAPVRRARVSLTGERLRTPEVTDADVNGRYTFTGLPPGSYRVTASKPGFVTTEAGAQKAGDRPAAVELAAGASLTLNVALPRGAAIEGTLARADGEPLQNVIVSAVRFDPANTAARPLVASETRTDDLGRYRLHSLPEGEYYVEASPDSRELAGAFVPDGDRPPGIARTYFPGTVRAHEARAVKLARGEQVGGLDFAALTVPLVRVSGRVTTSSGQPAKDYAIRLLPIDAPIASVSGFREPDGRFNFSAVPAGEYWVLASLVPPSRGPAEFAAMRMQFATDMRDLALTTAPGAVLHGRVDVDVGVGEPPRLAGVSVVAVPAEFELPQTKPPSDRAAVAADGSFVLNGLFGPNGLRVEGLPPAWEVSRISLDAQDITKAIVDFKASNAPRALRILIAPRQDREVAR
jgi:hypothetical protein